ncbi:uncharacterized protein [Henckelia pumila]|uniref:uncharacterized protein isoform X6 n=1 Tax=Henckelia pumila TaxID=405737 RepID=UPI003C6E9205
MYYLLRNPCPGAGACGGMCTANTMNSAIEAMGMSLPYSSITAVVACIIGLHYGHTLIQLQHHKERLWNWSVYSVLLTVLGMVLAFSGN